MKTKGKEVNMKPITIHVWRPKTLTEGDYPFVSKFTSTFRKESWSFTCFSMTSKFLKGIPILNRSSNIHGPKTSHWPHKKDSVL